VDIDFENAGVNHAHGFLMLRLHARVVLCGLISGYNDSAASANKADLSMILVKRVRIQGFIVIDYAKRYMEAAMQLGQWLAAGRSSTARPSSTVWKTRRRRSIAFSMATRWANSCSNRRAQRL